MINRVYPLEAEAILNEQMDGYANRVAICTGAIAIMGAGALYYNEIANFLGF